MNPRQIGKLQHRPTRMAELYRLRQDVERLGVGNVYKTLAMLTGLTVGQVAADLRDYKKKVHATGSAPQGRQDAESQDTAPTIHETASHPVTEPPEAHKGNNGGRLSWPTYVVGKDAVPVHPVESYTGQWELHGDFVVVGDVHVPTTDWAFAETMLKIASIQLEKPRQLVLAGDLMNMEALTRINKRQRIPPPLRDELRAADMFLTRMLDVFDEVYAFLGNHDLWFFELLMGDLLPEQFARLITNVHSRIHVSQYSEVFLVSGGERWYVPHQANYRQTKLSVGNDLAAKVGCNIITTHQHHSAVGRDRGNRFTIVDCGGLHEPSQMAYVMQRPNTRPDMTKGFVLLRNGCASLITPYPTMTDLGMWLRKPESTEGAAR